MARKHVAFSWKLRIALDTMVQPHPDPMTSDLRLCLRRHAPDVDHHRWPLRQPGHPIHFSPMPDIRPPSSVLRPPSSVLRPSIRIPIRLPPEQRQPDDLQIKKKIPVLDIMNIALDAPFDGSIPPPPVYLRPARDAGFHKVPHTCSPKCRF